MWLQQSTATNTFFRFSASAMNFWTVQHLCDTSNHNTKVTKPCTIWPAPNSSHAVHAVRCLRSGRRTSDPMRLSMSTGIDFFSHRCFFFRATVHGVSIKLSSTFFFFSFSFFCFFCFFFFFYCFVLFGAKPAQMRSNIALSFSPCRWLHVCRSSVSNFCQCLS